MSEDKIPETKRNKYFFSVIEEMVMNPGFTAFRGGRIEVFDNRGDASYPIYEARFLVPDEFFEEFYEVWDGKTADVMPFIRWDYEGEENE